MCQLHPVTFHGDTIFCVTFENQPYTPMKPIVENLGLDWRSQATKLRANTRRWGVVIIATPSAGGEQETTCMPVRKLPAYMASINPKKVRPELREKIELYQNECDDALWDYWTKGHAERQPSPAPAIEEHTTPSTADDRKPLRAIVNAWAAATGKGHSALWPQITAYFQLAKITELPKEWIPDAIAFVQERLDAMTAASVPAVQDGLSSPAPAPAVPEREAPIRLDVTNTLEAMHTSSARLRHAGLELYELAAKGLRIPPCGNETLRSADACMENIVLAIGHLIRAMEQGGYMLAGMIKLQQKMQGANG